MTLRKCCVYAKIPAAVIAVVTFLGFVDTFMLLPVIEWYSESLGATLAMAGLIVGAYSIVNTPVNIAFGRIVDRVGRRIPLILGLAWEATNMFSRSLCRIPTHLLIVRILRGTSGGIIEPATMAFMVDISPKTKSNKLLRAKLERHKQKFPHTISNLKESLTGRI
ncbi:MAG: MFS transporter [Candidatus Bathyarchaeia archaeon]